MRNMEKQIEQGHRITEKNYRLDLTLSELNYFKDNFEKDYSDFGYFDAIFNIVNSAYKVGLATGIRYKKSTQPTPTLKNLPRTEQ